MTHGGKLPEIAEMLRESTGRVFQHHEVYSVVKKLQKQFPVELEGLEVPFQKGDKVLQLGQRPYHGWQWRRDRLDS